MHKERGALYYPYIHVRDDNWLKATLLCFPYLERMVPKDYQLTDQPISDYFARPTLPGGAAMLRTRSLLDDEYAAGARMLLWERLKADAGRPELHLLERFGRTAAASDSRFKQGATAFEIHQHKVDSDFFEWLAERGLIWPSERRLEPETPWWCIHPDLGETLMSTYAVALARGHDLDIVTSAPAIHTALLAAEPDDVYEHLVARKPRAVEREDDTKVHDLMRFVIATDLDLSHVPPDKIVELAGQKEAISDLKARLAQLLASVGRVPDREMWEDTLRAQADELVKEWYDSKKLFRAFAQTFRGKLVGAGTEAANGVLKLAATAGFGVAVASSLAGALPGLVVGALFTAGSVLYNRRRSPYRFLSTLVAAGAEVTHPTHLLGN